MLKRVDVAAYETFKDAMDGNFSSGVKILGLQRAVLTGQKTATMRRLSQQISNQRLKLRAQIFCQVKCLSIIMKPHQAVHTKLVYSNGQYHMSMMI